MPKAMRAARARISHAAEAARLNPALRLGNRTTAALHTLLHAKKLSSVSHACANLERTTRLSRVCCAAFVEAGAPAIVFEHIRSLNRSMPHIDLLCCTLRTLRHVSSQPAGLGRGKAVPRLDICQPDTPGCVETLSDLLQMFRDKEEPFVLTCCLLKGICNAQPDAKVREPLLWILQPSRTHLTRMFSFHFAGGMFADGDYQTDSWRTQDLRAQAHT